MWGRDFPPVQTGPGAHSASCKMGIGSFPGVKCGLGVGLTPYTHLVPKVLEKSKTIPLLTLMACVAYKMGENLPILIKNSTCFGQIYCPSSGVLILYSQRLLSYYCSMTNINCCEYSIKIPDDGQ